MRIRNIVAIAIAVLFVAALFVPRLLSDRPDPVESGSSPSAQPPLTVDVLTLAPRNLDERLSTTGTIRANEQVSLVSEITGVVAAVEFKEGARVRAGDLLVRIVDTELRAQRDRVQYRLTLAKSREARQRELSAQGIVSEQEYDIVSNELDVLRAELRLVEAQLEKTQIRAPFAGIVGLRYVSEGSLVTPQTRIASLQNLDSVKIDFTLPEKYVGRLKPGSRVEFRVKSSDRARIAEVYAVEPRVDPETRSLLIRARAENPDGSLLPGAFADVTLAVDRVENALVVPSLAVIPELGGKKVFVVEAGLAQPRRVETGIRAENVVQVTDGLTSGDRVIVSAIQRLRPGLPVDPRAVEPEAGSR